ncbi:hypothetical protein BACCAP_04321 [Pseudoflavonifractor capillosus ATCC 29799]|uniref:Uncharacterized protein n=1 Tax=Pseudoflavonifractor capillosus ATCC 29799 TaxID=411467 RepID=A6P1F4_9FIRM|nr:hypothetical protein BACCAP_04321 [Pseudoflavonifractor capillosus ATCC 29799]
MIGTLQYQGFAGLRKIKRPITLRKTPSGKAAGRRFCVTGEAGGGKNQKKQV